MLPLALAAVVITCAAYLLWQLDPAYTFSFAIVLSPIAGNWQQLGIPGAIAPDRLLLVMGIAQVLLRSPAMRNRPPLQVHTAHILQALTVIYAVASAFIAGTLGTRADAFKIVDAFGALPFLAFLAAPLAFRTPRERGVLVVALVLLGGYLGLTTLFEAIHLNALVFPKYILNSNYGIHVGRGRGPFVDAVANGFAMFVCAAACGVAIATWASRKARLLATVIGILCVVGVFLSEERSVWIGGAAAGVITLLSAKGLRRYFLPVLAASTIAIVAVFLAVPGLSTATSQRANELGPIYDRANLTVAAVNMIKAKPLTGFGWGRFSAVSLPYFRQSSNYPLTATNAGIHNYALLYAVELGLPGLTLWALALFTGVGRAFLTTGLPDQSLWRAGLLAIFVMFVIVSNSVPPTLFQNLSLWLWAGVAYAGRYTAPCSLTRSAGVSSDRLAVAV